MKKKKVKQLIAKTIRKAIRSIPPGPPGPPGIMGPKGDKAICTCKMCTEA